LPKSCFLNAESKCTFLKVISGYTAFQRKYIVYLGKETSNLFLPPNTVLNVKNAMFVQINIQKAQREIPYFEEPIQSKADTKDCYHTLDAVREESF